MYGIKYNCSLIETNEQSQINDVQMHKANKKNRISRKFDLVHLADDRVKGSRGKM